MMKKWILLNFIVLLFSVTVTNNSLKDIDDSLIWAKNLSANDVQSIEIVISPSDRENHYKSFSSKDFDAIIKILNSSKGHKADAPAELGSTITLYITTKEGNIHTYQNLRNAYLVIDDIYFSADRSWLASSFRNFKGDASLPNGFFERVTGITTTYGLMKLGKNGKVLSPLSPLEGTYRQLADYTVFSYLIKSTQYPPQDIDSFDACYMLRVIHSSKNSNSSHDYYLFTMNGDTYIQSGKDGLNAKGGTELYNRIDTLLNSFI